MKWMKVLLVALSFAFVGVSAQAQNTTTEAPEKLIERLSGELLEMLKKDKDLRAGNIDRIMQVVDTKVLPHVNFPRMTAMAIGQHWRQATAEQKQQVQREFQLMLVRTYSGALDQVSQNVNIVMLPYRAAAADQDVLVRTEVRGQGNPVELSYRLRAESNGWKIYNVNVAGVWMVENYRSQFQPILKEGGLDGLITTLKTRNK